MITTETMLDKLVVRRLEIEEEVAFERATASWDNSAGFNWSAQHEGENFPDFVHRLKQQEKGLELPEGYVPATTLHGFLERAVVAQVSLRHRLNEHLLK